MNEEKNSFVVFTDIKEILDELDDKQVAALFRGMVDYQETGKVPNFRGALKYIFIPIRQQMDRNNEKWSKTKTVRSEAGRKGGLKAAENRASKSKQNVANEANATFAKQEQANQIAPYVRGCTHHDHPRRRRNQDCPVCTGMYPEITTPQLVKC